MSCKFCNFAIFRILGRFWANLANRVCIFFGVHFWALGATNAQGSLLFPCCECAFSLSLLSLSLSSLSLSVCFVSPLHFFTCAHANANSRFLQCLRYLTLGHFGVQFVHCDSTFTFAQKMGKRDSQQTRFHFLSFICNCGWPCGCVRVSLFCFWCCHGLETCLHDPLLTAQGSYIEYIFVTVQSKNNIRSAVFAAQVPY